MVIMRCEKHVPADTKVRFETERMALSGEMYELRLAQKIPEEFQRLRELAKPRILISRQEPRGTLPPVQQPQYPTSQPAPRTDIAPLMPMPVKAPGYTPLRDAVSPLPPPVLPPEQPTLLPPASFGQTDKK